MTAEPDTTDAPVPTPGAVKLGLITAVVIFLLDQISKLWLILGTEIRLTYPWPVTPFFDLTVVWNYGISYGLFQQHSELGRWALTLFKLGAAVFLTFWLRKSANRLETVGIGMIIGGAIGNALDRVLHGAVFDFAHFHVGDFSWYVFNIADAGIVIGVGFMLLGQILPARAAAEKP
ncbi:MAG: signal peptidase II [Rhizobiales bacterium PAR1]|nr:MAG: signal peptidase II [Rhizobiales bacterium PAR1]